MFDVRSGIQSGPANLQRAAFARGGRAAAFAFLRRPCLRMCDAQMIEAQEAVASRSPRCVHALIPSGSAGSAGAGGCSVWVIWLGFGLRVGDGSGKMDRSTCAVVVASLCVKWRVCMNRVRE
ncbi:hypothetical protein PsYK624_021800 [Phanerochaete sordida]|uniref:Uncharacterized protein n=1 Tax=Phanerochaete sordida TaxID=48140 RepID=A0A9P3G1S5_9APHY|nr:hypothetical protein PsYK624_021800 [Phanerochaete sordida]